MTTKELPNAPEVEASIVSSIIQAPNNIYNCIQLLSSECFYSKKYRAIWDEIVKLHTSHQKIDIIALTQNLTDSGNSELTGGALGLVELTSQYFTSDVAGLSKILYQKYMRRMTIMEAHKLISNSFDLTVDIFDTVSRSKKNLFEAISPSVSNVSTANNVILETLRDISENLGKYQEVVGVPSGFED